MTAPTAACGMGSKMRLDASFTTFAFVGLVVLFGIADAIAGCICVDVEEKDDAAAASCSASITHDRASGVGNDNLCINFLPNVRIHAVPLKTIAFNFSINRTSSPPFSPSAPHAWLIRSPQFVALNLLIVISSKSSSGRTSSVMASGS